MFGIGFTEILLILGVALIIIGPDNLPGMAKSLGKGYIEFMRSFREMQRSIQEDVSEIQSTLDDATNVFDSHEGEPQKEDSGPKKKDFDYPGSESDNK